MSKDYFLVVETIEAGRPVLSVVPHKWVNENILFWPPKQAHVLRKIVGSSPMPSWTKLPCAVKRKFIPSFAEAEQEAGELSGQSTDASDFAPKRKKKPKKVSTAKTLDLNHVITKQPKLSIRPDAENATETQIPVAIEMVEQVYCQPDLFNLTVNSQGNALDTQPTPPAQTSASTIPEETVLSEGYVVNIQQPDTDRIIREISEKVVEEVSVNVLNLMEAMLAKTAASLEIKIDAALRESNMHPYPEASNSFQFSPVNSTTGIDALEENLNDELFAKQFFAHMKRKIGNSGDACNGQNIAYGLVDHFFERKVMLDCSWTGESKGGNVKFAFKKCVNILDMFFKLVHSVNNTFSQTLLEDLFKRFTRNAKKRSESKGKRQSSIHRRSKSKASEKDIHCNQQISAIATNDAYCSPQITGVSITETPSHSVQPTGSKGLHVTNSDHDEDEYKEEELEEDEGEMEEDENEEESSQESESDL